VKKSINRILYVDEIPRKNPVFTWKVITPEAAHSAGSGFAFLSTSSPEQIFTDTYIGFDCNSEEAKSLLSFLKTKIANYLLSLKKNSQHINSKTIEYIPLPPLLYEDGKGIIWTDEMIEDYFGIERSMYMKEKEINKNDKNINEICLAITKDGKQCSKKAKSYGFCGIHEKKL